MREKNSVFVFKILAVLSLLLYVNFFEVTDVTMKIDAILTLALSLLNLIRSRKNLIISLAMFFILYCNYSIVVGEYLVGGNLGVPVYEVKTLEIYGTSIRTLLLFTLVITLFYKNKAVEISKINLDLKDNMVIFYGIYAMLMYILFFGINRSQLTSYSVSVTPLYEYSSLLFLFAYYFSGKSPIRKFILISMLILFVLQDFYYGGRITSLQLIFLFLLTFFKQKLTFRKIMFFGFVGIIVNGLVGAYRSSFSLNSINVLQFLINLKDKLFVFDTPVYAYYASATHVAAANVANLNTKLSSFFAFISSVLFGTDYEIGNLTRYVSRYYFYNIGGGVIPTHFYFWLGWGGIIFIAAVIVFVMNRFSGLKSDYQKLCAIIVIMTVPRWYLYSPLSLFRPLLFLSILFLIFSFTHVVLSKRTKKSRIDKTNHISNHLKETT